jgi:hypothetical protein
MRSSLEVGERERRRGAAAPRLEFLRRRRAGAEAERQRE